MSPYDNSITIQEPIRLRLAWLYVLLTLALFSLSLSHNALGAETVKERVGYAYGAESGSLLYSEHHQEWWKGGRILRDTVTYRDAQGNIIGEKHVDFRTLERAPRFLLRNIRTGHSEGAIPDSDKLNVSFRRNREAALKKEALELPEGAIVDAGFDRFVENNWNALMRGEAFVQPFLVPSRLEFIDFRIQRVDDGSDPERTTLEMAADSPLLRLFAPAITVVYGTRDRSLLEYDGVSNIRDAGGENLDVEIRFDPSRSDVSAASPSILKHGAIN
ncbi:MAG TPA: hypothetical protein VLS27_11560 [Gammaproteobacteria bacterium]|nr:hypothetical protein [Gammaproteobacteria bacterium]